MQNCSQLNIFQQGRRSCAARLSGRGPDMLFTATHQNAAERGQRLPQPRDPGLALRPQVRQLGRVIREGAVASFSFSSGTVHSG